MVRRLSALLVCLGLGVTACGGSSKPEPTAKTKKTERKSLLTQAREQVRESNIDEADGLYAQAYEVDANFEVLSERISFLSRAGRNAKAVEVAKEYYDGNATDAKGYALYAEALLASNKGQEALEVAEALISLDVESPAGQEKKGRALILLDKADEGVTALRTAVQMDPQNAMSHLALGNALQKLGQVNDAALEFRAALKADSDNVEAYVMLGGALRQQNELQESRQNLDKAIELDKENGRAWFELGLLYNQQGKQQEAESALSKAVQKSPNESLFWYAYGEIYRLQQRDDEALNAYRRAVDLDPPHPKAISKLGALLVERKMFEEAETLLIQSIRRNGKNAAAYFNLGLVYAAQKKKQLALENYEKYLSIAPKSDPDRAAAQRAVSQLKGR